MKCLAPMVDGSELPFRLLLHNITHAWTPMYNANKLTNDPKFAECIVKSIEFEKKNTNHTVIL